MNDDDLPRDCGGIVPRIFIILFATLVCSEYMYVCVCADFPSAYILVHNEGIRERLWVRDWMNVSSVHFNWNKVLYKYPLTFGGLLFGCNMSLVTKTQTTATSIKTNTNTRTISIKPNRFTRLLNLLIRMFFLLLVQQFEEFFRVASKRTIEQSRNGK